ncbi:hypothetical protein V5P93_005910 [Actinokineospora auranticolor]|uniref:Uncharacterized protein n=1 Tax=Actinokineospora auranticolor TaxID=155976 RepID=A0A2S6GHM6_9PSEU|nr:hypothetical protein [Actinokineospora auranticolor]PPK64700.1 hypothetical protein CLV40_11890 [Actinokineospora auranticolor]
MTDTPIYDQIRQELLSAAQSDKTDPQPRTRQRSEPESGTGVSVWALIDEHRTPDAKPGRRRS